MKLSLSLAVCFNLFFISCEAIKVSEEFAPIHNEQPQDILDLKEELYEEASEPDDLDVVRIKMAEEVDKLDPELKEEEMFALEETKTRAIRGVHYKECHRQKDCDRGYCLNFECYIGKKGDPCVGTGDCKESLLCLKKECDRGGTGVHCDKDEQCKSGFDCVRSECKKVSSGGGGDKAGEGESCDSNSNCKKDYYCYKHKCYNGSEGDPCSKSSECQSGGKIGRCRQKECLYDDKHSPPQHHTNEDKDDYWYGHNDYWYGHNDYWYGHWYDSNYGKVGDHCVFHGECRDGNYCRHLECRDGSRGDPCKYHFECKSSKCIFKKCN